MPSPLIAGGGRAAIYPIRRFAAGCIVGNSAGAVSFENDMDLFQRGHGNVVAEWARAAGMAQMCWK